MSPLIGITPDFSGGRYSIREEYTSTLFSMDFKSIILPFDSSASTFAKLDGIVISGGDDINPCFYGEVPLIDLDLIDERRTAFEIHVFNECLRSRKPILGICNGMQLMNVALKGTLHQDIGRQMPLALDHKSGYHKITMLENGFAATGQYSVNTAHHQAIKELGNVFKVIAKSEDGIIEAISVNDHPFAFGVQWHPERDPDNPINKTLFLKFREACCAA